MVFVRFISVGAPADDRGERLIAYIGSGSFSVQKGDLVAFCRLFLL